MKKDASVQTDFSEGNSQRETIHFEIKEPRLPVFYDPDTGLYVQGLTDAIFNNFTFINCNVSFNVQNP